MWITKDVNVPLSLIEAQKTGRLVIFAGAGVSIGSPSDLPSFSDLARRIGNDVTARRASEPLDEYLGRVEALGADIQRLTKEIIGSPASRPRQIHRDIAALFANADSVRIITTNFDSHFSTALTERFAAEVDTYVGPALPLGRDFAGLAYLHGSAHQRGRLVLTDRDFGRAYLTDGWATRMMLDVFQNFAVLFIGYSHDDPVMKYLARSLSGHAERFVLALPGEEEKWMRLGINAIHFPAREPDRHAALNEAIHAWANLLAMGALEHERRVAEITHTTPPLDREAADYIASALRDEMLLRFFVNNAKSIEWLRWAETQGAFGKLLSREHVEGEIPALIGNWFTTTFAIQHPREAMAVVAAGGGKLSPMLSNQLASHLYRYEPMPDPEVLRKWIAILLTANSAPTSSKALSWILLRCVMDEHLESAKFLFRHLISLSPILERPWTLDSEETRPTIRISLGLRGDDYSLRKAWTEIFLPRAWMLRHFLKPAFEQTIGEAHSFATAETNGAFDPVSFGRSAIEPHSQDEHHGGIGLVIDGLRDLLQLALSEDAALARLWIAEWLRSGIPLLRRLGLHGIAEDSALNSDIAIRTLIENQLLFAPQLKHEAFRVLQKHFSRATSVAQKELIAFSKTSDVLADNDDDPTRRAVSDYERYNVLVWLARVAPESPSALAAVQLARERHPAFSERDHPDFDSWTSGGFVGEDSSPRSPEELLRTLPSDQLDFLLSYHRPADTWDGPTRNGLLAAIKTAAGTDRGWALALASALASRADWNSDLWRALIEAWVQSEHKEAEFEDIVNSLECWPGLCRSYPSEVSGLVESLVDSKLVLPEARLDALARIAIQCFEREGPVHEFSGRSGRTEWLAVSLNQTGGRATLVLVKLLSKQSGLSKLTELPDVYRDIFNHIINFSSPNAVHGQTILGSQLHFLLTVDSTWTTASLLPLFDWSRDEITAEYVWHGYLGWGRWNDALLHHLLPYLSGTFQRIETSLSGVVDSLTSRFAGIALFASADPWHGGWLVAFIRHASESARVRWAGDIYHQLQELSDEAVRLTWDRWLRDYWKSRLAGVPKPLSQQELAEMLPWATRLMSVFGEVVKMLCEREAVLSEHTMFFYELTTSRVVTEAPDDVARLVDHVLASNVLPLYECAYVQQVVGQLQKNGVDRLLIKPIIASMVRFGCGKSEDFREFIS